MSRGRVKAKSEGQRREAEDDEAKQALEKKESMVSDDCLCVQGKVCAFAVMAQNHLFHCGTVIKPSATVWSL